MGDFTAEYVQAVVESAGRTLMMQPNAGCWPAQIRSCWPDAPDDEWFAYDANDTTPPKIRATIHQMNELLMVTESWIPLIQHVGYRRAVTKRMLRYPDTSRPVFNWIRLGKHLGQDRRLAKQTYLNGIQHLTDRLNRAPGHP